MAFLLPHFSQDVFVSYSHGDPRNQGGSMLMGWTHALINKLKNQIFSLDTEFDDLQIWMDEQIDPTAHLTDELRARASACGILMIVLSKRYLGSSWCRDELEWFRTQIRDREGDVGRVFVLRVQRTDTSTWPDFLRDERGHAMSGFTFYDLATDLPHGWPDLRDMDRDFVQELCRLSGALTKRLRELRERAEKRAQVKLPRPGTGQASLVGRRIYLHAASDAGPVRADIDGLLKEDGINPMTAKAADKNDLAAWQVEERMRRKMAKQCEALALLRANDSERFEDDVLEIGCQEREYIASERGAPLPCAVLDKSGADLPLDLRQLDIEHFDVTRDGWRGHFRQWLDANRASLFGADP